MSTNVHVRAKEVKRDDLEDETKTMVNNPMNKHKEVQIHTDPASGRRYTFNPRTSKSKWLDNFDEKGMQQKEVEDLAHEFGFDSDSDSDSANSQTYRKRGNV